MRKKGLWIASSVFVILLAVFAYLYFFPLRSQTIVEKKVVKKDLVLAWEKLAVNRIAKLVYAQPPKLFILYLHTGERKEVPGVVVAGGPGRVRRGFSPRPFWSGNGLRFLYRYNNQIFVCDENGNKRAIDNKLMDKSKETRWSWWSGAGFDWAVGPSKQENVIMVRIDDPRIIKTIYSGGNVKKHCELTANGRFLVYAIRDIFVIKTGAQGPGLKISKGQSCRPCAAPDNRVAWLPAPHTRYLIHDAKTGLLLQELPAPPGEGIYRLNWSNLPDFAVHMFGSRGNDRIHVRKISTNESLFVGHGWDPDLWIDAEVK